MSIEEQILQERIKKWEHVQRFFQINWPSTLSWDAVMCIWELARKRMSRGAGYSQLYHDAVRDMEVAFSYMPQRMGLEHAVEVLYRITQTLEVKQ